jgi:hypothetical protein
MSPTAREVVVNRALSGPELRKIIHAKLDYLMDNEGLLSNYAAFGRVGFSVTLALHLDNPLSPESSIEYVSRNPAVNEPDALLARVESIPLAEPSAEASLSGSQLDYKIDSPNKERLRHGIPVPVDVKQPDGTVSQQIIPYPPDPALGDGNLSLRDVTPATAEKFNPTRKK